MTRRKLARAIVEHTTRTVSEAMAGRVAQASVVTSPFADTSEELTVQFEGSSVAVPVKGIRNIPVFPGMKVLMVNIHSDWVCIGPYSNPSVGTGATRIAIGADVPQELRDSHDIETVMLFYAVDPATGLEAGYFFKGVSNLFNGNSPTLLEGEVRYPTLGDPSSPTSSNVKPNRQSIMMSNLVPVDQVFNMQIASIGGFFIQSGGRFGVIDGLTGTSEDVFDITKTSGVVDVTLSAGANFRMPTFHVAKTASETLGNSTTLQDDNDLKLVGAKANTRYAVKGFLMVMSPAAADIKLTLSVPASAQFNLVGSTFSRLAAAGSRLVDTQMILQGENMVIPTQGTTFSTQSQWIVLEGQVAIAGTAGDIVLQWAKNAADAGDTTMVLNSWMTFTELN